MQDTIAIFAVLVSVIFAFLFGRKTKNTENAERRLKTIDKVERIERDVQTQDDVALASRITRKP